MKYYAFNDCNSIFNNLSIVRIDKNANIFGFDIKSKTFDPIKDPVDVLSLTILINLNKLQEITDSEAMVYVL